MPLIRLVRMLVPAARMSGSASVMSVMMVVMICGSASTSVGMAVVMPSIRLVRMPGAGGKDVGQRRG